MTEEANDGVAYLRALRQSSGSAAAAEPARSDAPIPEADNPEKPYQGLEKRRSPRYKCEGSAQIHEDGCDVPTWVIFTDISLHGCYVEAQATFPVGTVLHMKLQANDIRVETIGEVRVNYPYLGMGIAFSEISEENRTNLKELLGTLARPTIILGPGIAPSLSSSPLEGVPPVSDPAAAIRAVIEFFESRQVLMRDDFLGILKKSQK